MKVLHVLDHSLPHFSSYSLRSDYIIRAQRRLGLQPVVVTSPVHDDFTDGCERIGEVDYYRLDWPGFPAPSKGQPLPMVKQMACVGALSKEIRRLAGELKIDLIHSHSPSLGGLAAARASEQVGVPWIYELRYYDEDAAVDRGQVRHNSLRYRTSQRLEHFVLERAGCVVTISAALRDDLIKRGTPENKIFEVPQGVDTDLFHPLDPDPELLAKYALTGKTVIGFAGAPGNYEALGWVVDTIWQLSGERPEVVLFLVGDADAVENIRRSVPESWRGHVISAVDVPHHEMHRYYSVMDLVIYPWLRSRQTELVPSLSLLEAMAMGRLVVGSDLGVVRELLKDGERGLLVDPGDTKALADCLARPIGDQDLRRALGERAREFVERERDWEQITERYLAIYERAKERR